MGYEQVWTKCPDCVNGKIRKIEGSQVTEEFRREIEWEEDCPICKGTGKITNRVNWDSEKVKKILSQEVTIDEQVVTDRLDRWDCHSGGIHEDDVNIIADQLKEILTGRLK